MSAPHVVVVLRIDRVETLAPYGIIRGVHGTVTIEITREARRGYLKLNRIGAVVDGPEQVAGKGGQHGICKCAVDAAGGCKNIKHVAGLRREAVDERYIERAAELGQAAAEHVIKLV